MPTAELRTERLLLRDIMPDDFDAVHAYAEDPDNQASARVLEKTGLSLEGRMRHHMQIKGRWRDSLLYARLGGDPA
ncbi:GNAT family N-acetyltransferase [Kineosporia rhizophila]|uniref:GNAT family N-acetyltransferase n=1 Tax=Kineosporia TaxID=49184 RepID=UPI000A7367BB|nr:MULTISPECIES: GNAT family protein [Kineosporia]MCE0539334.1 GNAT family N-acetyltransferase [Kineosporia rhizophila]GLY19915.1 hypothetical protein Kisp01_69290 [Kineosporia sp. NBRC 101677]